MTGDSYISNLYSGPSHLQPQRLELLGLKHLYCFVGPFDLIRTIYANIAKSAL